MLVNVEMKKVVHITLNEQEAHWLQAVMQNPLYDVNPVDEDQTERTNRINLF